MHCARRRESASVSYRCSARGKLASVPGALAGQSYTREQVKRLLRIDERQLKRWEEHGLVPRVETYSFAELIALRTLVSLRKENFRTDHLQRILDAVRRRVGDVPDPLRQLKIFRDGRRITVQVARQRIEPYSGQLLLDFDRGEIDRLRGFPQPNEQRTAQARKAESDSWFQRGLEMEQAGAAVAQVIDAYQRSISADPNAAGAMVNLGTIYFNARLYKQAEAFYRRAVAADPRYPLAQFNLANLLDELNDRRSALEHYQEALRLAPAYADAHYNIALLYQAAGDVMSALRHWRVYLKLDPHSQWAHIARREMEKLRTATVLPGKGA